LRVGTSAIALKNYGTVEGSRDRQVGKIGEMGEMGEVGSYI
jgi:hypothetical protein